MCCGGGDCREMMAENFPEWIKDMDLWIQEDKDFQAREI